MEPSRRRLPFGVGDQTCGQAAAAEVRVYEQPAQHSQPLGRHAQRLVPLGQALPAAASVSATCPASAPSLCTTQAPSVPVPTSHRVGSFGQWTARDGEQRADVLLCAGADHSPPNGTDGYSRSAVRGPGLATLRRPRRTKNVQVVRAAALVCTFRALRARNVRIEASDLIACTLLTGWTSRTR